MSNMTRNRTILLLIGVGMVAGCVSGKKTPDTYTAGTGSTVRIESSREQCTTACNRNYDTCMDSYGAQNSGVNMPSGMTGASAECRSSLSACTLRCTHQ